MRTMCTYEHGIRDDVHVISEDRTYDFNETLKKYLATGWRLIQPIETEVVMPSSGTFAKTHHTAVLARRKDYNDD